MSFCLTITTNAFPIFSSLLVKAHKNLLPTTVENLEFWMAYLSKLIAYSFNLIINFNLFLSKGDNIFTPVTPPHYQKEFICKEDQAAYNMILFVIIITINSIYRTYIAY